MAKWVIPSAGVLVASVGFVIESAHQNLLGVDLGDLGARAYVWAFAQFLRDVSSALVTGVFLPGFFKLSIGIETTLVALSLLLLAAIGRRQWLAASQKTPWTRSPYCALAALLAISLLRLWYIDLPVTRIENMLGRGAESVSTRFNTELRHSIAESEQLDLARGLYSLIICSRPVSQPPARIGVQCDPRRQYRTDIVKLLLTSLGLSLVSLLAAWQLRRLLPAGVNAFILAPLAIHAALAPAYVYGKFGKSTTFEQALVQLSTDVVLMPTTAASASKPGQTAGSAKLMNAIVLARDDKFLMLYVNQRTACGKAGQHTDEWVPWKIALGQALVVREITGVDVIAERLNEVPCAPSQLPAP